ncbi:MULTISPECIES: BON domain-containing protein [Paraburkholderia]|jgi:hyperosmotically inducible protein|uniref:BON domain-containing protein n=1 Tax=Paraburkholderia phenazinium TaxID=60549 RepID=A0A1N6FAR1_9BURK|nr:BON domain-containing protein [Paraburkholderia phenazinium]SIN92368.1 BON domain-containing protein [Paraburkholderia phenazinium]
MKAFQVIKAISGALIVMASLNAYAQSSDATAAPAMSAAPSAKATRASNRALQRKVLKALAKAKGLTAENITVRARGGVVTLEGRVSDQGQSDIATQTAQGVAGVTSVTNALQVREQ